MAHRRERSREWRGVSKHGLSDQLIAEVQGEFTRFPSLEMAIDGFSLAWSRDGIQIPAERNVKSFLNVCLAKNLAVKMPFAVV